jgi:hypothetical protein
VYVALGTAGAVAGNLHIGSFIDCKLISLEKNSMPWKKLSSRKLSSFAYQKSRDIQKLWVKNSSHSRNRGFQTRNMKVTWEVPVLWKENKTNEPLPLLENLGSGGSQD